VTFQVSFVVDVLTENNKVMFVPLEVWRRRYTRSMTACNLLLEKTTPTLSLVNWSYTVDCAPIAIATGRPINYTSGVIVNGLSAHSGQAPLPILYTNTNISNPT